MENANIGQVWPIGVPRAGGETRTLREATQEFESLFVAHLLQSMRSTVPESGLLASGSGQRIFREMLDQELSRQVACSGGFGIGELLYRQLGGEQQSQPAEKKQESQANENR
jgi:flagellar protein FlgJ